MRYAIYDGIELTIYKRPVIISRARVTSRNVAVTRAVLAPRGFRSLDRQIRYGSSLAGRIPFTAARCNVIRRSLRHTPSRAHRAARILALRSILEYLRLHSHISPRYAKKILGGFEELYSSCPCEINCTRVYGRSVRDAGDVLLIAFLI